MKAKNKCYILEENFRSFFKAKYAITKIVHYLLHLLLR